LDAKFNTEVEMAEVRLQIPDSVIRDLQEKIGTDIKATDIAKDAITLFKWAVQERAKGRVILSSTDDFEKVSRLAMASIESAEPPAPRNPQA
jgi:hypothetical protein